jgi:hypothetical protein
LPVPELPEAPLSPVDVCGELPGPSVPADVELDPDDVGELGADGALGVE